MSRTCSAGCHLTGRHRQFHDQGTMIAPDVGSDFETLNREVRGNQAVIQRQAEPGLIHRPCGEHAPSRMCPQQLAVFEKTWEVRAPRGDVEVPEDH